MSDTEDEKKKLPFHEMELDERILKAIAKLGWIDPTLIQVKLFYFAIMKYRTSKGKFFILIQYSPSNKSIYFIY